MKTSGSRLSCCNTKTYSFTLILLHFDEILWLSLSKEAEWEGRMWCASCKNGRKETVQVNWRIYSCICLATHHRAQTKPKYLTYLYVKITEIKLGKSKQACWLCNAANNLHTTPSHEAHTAVSFRGAQRAGRETVMTACNMHTEVDYLNFRLPVNLLRLLCEVKHLGLKEVVAVLVAFLRRQSIGVPSFLHNATPMSVTLKRVQVPATSCGNNRKSYSQSNNRRGRSSARVWWPCRFSGWVCTACRCSTSSPSGRHRCIQQCAAGLQDDGQTRGEMIGGDISLDQVLPSVYYYILTKKWMLSVGILSVVLYLCPLRHDN